jgi:cobalamin-dependent methionine synthase I
MKSVDPNGALQMYMNSGDWEKCLELAKEQVTDDYMRLDGPC